MNLLQQYTTATASPQEKYAEQKLWRTSPPTLCIEPELHSDASCAAPSMGGLNPFAAQYPLYQCKPVEASGRRDPAVDEAWTLKAVSVLTTLLELSKVQSICEPLKLKVEDVSEQRSVPKQKLVARGTFQDGPGETPSQSTCRCDAIMIVYLYTCVYLHLFAQASRVAAAICSCTF